MRKLFEDNAIDIDAIIEQGWLEEAGLWPIEACRVNCTQIRSRSNGNSGSRQRSLQVILMAAYQYAFWWSVPRLMIDWYQGGQRENQVWR